MRHLLAVEFHVLFLQVLRDKPLEEGMRHHHVTVLLRAFGENTHLAIRLDFVVQIVLPALNVILMATVKRHSFALGIILVEFHEANLADTLILVFA